MAASETKTNLEDVLKPFYQRASEVEDRLSRLEASVASNRDAGSEEHLKTISELQAKLEGANAELALEREKAKKLAVENGKLQYRVIHLVHAIREGDAKLEGLKVFFGPQKLSDFFSSEKSGATSEDCGEKSLISALVGCSL